MEARFRFSPLLFEFFKILSVALLWVIVFAIALGSFGDYQPDNFTVHASSGSEVGR